MQSSYMNPYDSSEFHDLMAWEKKTKSKGLEPNLCIAGWMDICGFGARLEKYKWDLAGLQESNMLKLLNSVYSLAADSLLINTAPYPFESVLIINDGIARSVDLKYIEHVHEFNLARYLMDLVIKHYQLLNLTNDYKLGIRTVLAGGERIQYAPITKSGASYLFYDENNISDYGKKLLDQNFLYNPAEFQMNTAFAKAYTIDSYGSKSGFTVNGFFIEETFLKNLSKHPRLKINYYDDKIEVLSTNDCSYELRIEKTVHFEKMSLNTKVYKISSLFDYRENECIDLINYKYG